MSAQKVGRWKTQRQGDRKIEIPEVTWTNVPSNLKTKGNKIKRIASDGDYWSHASIVQKISHGTGYVKFDVGPLANPGSSTIIVGINKSSAVAANDEYNFSFCFSGDEIAAYEYGDIGAYATEPLVPNAKFRLKMLSGSVEYQIKNPGDSDYVTFVTSALHMDNDAEYTVNVTIRTKDDGVHILRMATEV